MGMGFQAFPQPTVMGHQFSQVPQAQIERSAFKRSFGHKTTFDEGWLIPIYCDEALPGDTFKVNLSSVARLTTPLVPFMDNVYMDFFFFAVPNRLVWTNFQKFMGEKENPDDDVDYYVPQIDMGTNIVNEGDLFDYMGLPINKQHLTFNALHTRAYNLIWNEWFRDQNLQDSVVVDKDDGPDTHTDYVKLKRGKRHDYFTSCLPWPQKGEAVVLPLGSTAPVIGDGKVLGLMNGTTGYGLEATSGNYLQGYAGNYNTNFNPGGIPSGAPIPQNVSVGVTTEVGKSGMITDLSLATAATINELREAFQLQKLMERDARGGTRYVEILKSHFGVTSPDARLQRPEYLGGGSKRIMVDPVPSTINSSGEPTITNLGYLGAAAYCNQSGIGFTKSFVEHCVILGLVSVRADLNYQHGINRMWSRRTKYDFYWPALAHIGEQAVLKKEIYAAGTSADEQVFGYQERWAEYRYHPSLITGKLRSSSGSGLDCWHLAQDFVNCPVLDDTFIKENPPISRVVSATGQPHFVFDSYFDVTCTRPMPIYSIPGLIDHF